MSNIKPDKQITIDDILYDVFVFEMNDGEDVTGDLVINCQQHTWGHDEWITFLIQQNLILLYTYRRESKVKDCTGIVTASHYYRKAIDEHPT